MGTLDPSDEYRKLHQLLSPETNKETHLKMGFPKRKLVFQPFIFRGYVGFREGKKSDGFLDPLLLKPAHVDRVAVLRNQFPY